MKLRSPLTIALLLLAGAGLTAAQVPNADVAMKIVDGRKANARLMHQFTWNCRTELMDGGKVGDIRIELVNYGPDGTLQRSLLNEQGAHMPIGFLRKAVAENKKQQTEKYLAGLRSLLDQYTLPTAGKVIGFMASASLEFTQAPDGSTLLQMSGTDVVMPGDTLSMWVDASTHAMRKVQITTTFEGDPTNVTATFKTLSASGLTFMSMAEVAVPAKHMTLQVQNYDYQQND